MPQLRKTLTAPVTAARASEPAPAVRFLKVDVGTEFEDHGHSYRVTSITDCEVTAELLGHVGAPLRLPRINIETPKPVKEDAMTQLSGMLPVNNLPMRKGPKGKGGKGAKKGKQG